MGELNSSFKGKTIFTSHGYILEYCPNHPFSSKKHGRIRQHRLVIERNYKKFDPKYFETINGYLVLKLEYDVHHINENTQDNRLENLQVLTRSEHSRHHNLQKTIIRDNLGRIIGVIKSGNIGENPIKENPEINSEIAKGSESL